MNNRNDKEIFNEIVKYVQKINILHKMKKKVIGGYSDQLTGYDSLHMIALYEKCKKNGDIINFGWFLRIPQHKDTETPLTLFIPKCFAVTSDSEKIELHDKEKKAFIYPKNIEDFLLHPDQYVDWTKEDTRTY